MQGEFLIFRNAFQNLPRIDRFELESELMKLDRTVVEQLFDLPLQFYTVMAQYLNDLVLLGSEFADNIVGEQLCTFTQRSERRLQVVRYLL